MDKACDSAALHKIYVATSACSAISITCEVLPRILDVSSLNLVASMAAIFLRRFLGPLGESSRAEFLAISSQCPSKIILNPWNDLSFPDGVVGSHELPMWTVENRARYDRSRLRCPSGGASGSVHGSFAH